jgi:SAM-dependent methyltransferase
MNPGTLAFRCNICGGDCQTDLTNLRRETISCNICGSTTRRRAIIRALTAELFGESLALPDIPERRDIKGLGMTDWEDYAPKLAEKFDYRNTFYHKEPKLDISDAELAGNLIDSSDFIISSDVFEHVVPPISRAFKNAWKILRPGGVFILTVPYAPVPKTIEHFPDLNDFTLIEKDNSYVLRNVTESGAIQEFEQLVFHGGPGSVLEMRVFGEEDLLQHLRDAGFEDTKVYRTPDFLHGVWWPESWSLPISARKATS